MYLYNNSLTIQLAQVEDPNLERHKTLQTNSTNKVSEMQLALSALRRLYGMIYGFPGLPGLDVLENNQPSNDFRLDRMLCGGEITLPNGVA